MSGTVTPILSVFPTRGLVDNKFKVMVENLPPGLPVTLHSLHQSEDKDYWEAYGHYVSDDRGTVTVSEDMSIGGTYTGKETMGLLWSMRPVPGSRTGLRLRKMDIRTPMVVLISVYREHVIEGCRERLPMASVVTERWYMAPGIQRIDIRERGVRGTLFIPRGPGPFPGLLDLWGGGGGLVEYRAALLASHGYVSMALEYFSPNELGTDIGLSYFEKAFTIIQEHPQVIKDRVGICGLSLGTAVTLTMAACSNLISPRCCVGISGSHTVLVSKSVFDGFQHVNKNDHKVRVDEQNRVIWRDLILPIPSDPSKKVDVGRIKCPLLLVCGDDDQSWAAVESAEDIAKMMRAAGNEHLLTTVTYHNAGHLIEPPYTPLTNASNFLVYHTKQKVVLLWGGETKPHADAQEDSWEKILAFLRQHLYPCPSSAPQDKL
ncbi:peroxisomal succinyl-coenzyme A thioesterase-like [Centroberyx affinis]|uniref:peroxisomal succinyl-coenzyme A thioesterase-like n=1 Tax=Centroberyx affinis TaxID=166261 RepID=UPI003A5BEAFA